MIDIKTKMIEVESLRVAASAPKRRRTQKAA